MKIAPGSPKRHRTSLSAATGEVLTRFARRHPSDLGHPKYSKPDTGTEPLLPGRRIRAVHVDQVAPASILLPLQNLQKLSVLGRHGGNVR